MNDRDVERRLRTALEHAAPDDLAGILSRCSPGRDRIIPIQTSQKRRFRGWTRLIAAACLALVLAGGGTGAYLYRAANTVASVVSLDVNPSIELDVNRNERVLQASALNSDATEVLDGMDLKGTDLNVAVNAIMGSLLRHGYVDELANSILISVEDENLARGTALEQQLTGEIGQVLESAQVNGAILSQTLSRDETLQQKADLYGISLGKASLIQSLVDGSNHLTFEDLVGLSINELNLLANSTAVQASADGGGETTTAESSDSLHSTGTASQSAYIGVEAAKAAALAHAGVDASDVVYSEADYDYEDGHMVYEVEFYAGGREYEYDVDAVTGAILADKWESGADGGGTWHGEPSNGGISTSYIGAEAARTAALAHAGVSLSEVYELEVDEELDERTPHYQVEFKAGGWEYEYDIDAVTGEVLSYEQDWD